MKLWGEWRMVTKFSSYILQHSDISVCRYSLYISDLCEWLQGSLRRACSSFWLYNEQFSCCLLVLDHFYCTSTTSLTCTGRYTQLLQLLVQTKPVIAQDVTMMRPKYIFKDKPTSRCSLTSLWCLFMSRRNATFWSKVGKTGVGKTGGGEQVPIHINVSWKLLAVNCCCNAVLSKVGGVGFVCETQTYDRVLHKTKKTSGFSQVMGVYSMFVGFVTQLCSPSNVCVRGHVCIHKAHFPSSPRSA